MKSKWKVVAIVVCVMMYLTSGLAYGDIGLATSGWPRFRGGLSNNGRSSYVGPETPEVIWSLDIDGSFGRASPVVGPCGTIYLGTGTRGTLFAISPKGTIKWSVETGKRIENAAAVGKDGILYILSGNVLYAISSMGKVLWTFEMGYGDAQIPGSPAIGPDGTIYVNGGDPGFNNYALVAVNPDGTEKWRFKVYNVLYASPAIGEDGTIYVVGRHRRVHALRPDGSEKWHSQDLGEIIWTGPLLDSKGNVYVTVQPDKLISLDSKGEVRWTAEIEGAGNVQSQPALSPDEGTIYLGSSGEGKRLFAVDTVTGLVKWRGDVGPNILSSPIVDSKGTIYMGSRSNYFYAFNPDGSLKWKADIRSGVSYSSPAMGEDGVIYVVTGKGLVAIGD